MPRVGRGQLGETEARLVKDKRRHARVPSRQRCWCEGPDITIYAPIENLSEGGLFLRSPAPLARGTHVRLRLGSDGGEVRASAAVVWRRDGGASDEEPGMGLRFEALDKRASAALRGQLGRLLRGKA